MEKHFTHVSRGKARQDRIKVPSRGNKVSWLLVMWQKLKYPMTLLPVFIDNHLNFTTQDTESSIGVWKSAEPPTASAEKVWEHLENLNMHKSTGHDKIYLWVPKEVVAEVSRPIVIIFEKLGKSDKVPTDWKGGSTTPIFKKGKKEIPKNYRSASLTSVPSKIME